jgi:hypothetical protein
MQDLPPPPAYQCVKPEAVKQGKSYLVVAGSPAQVAALIVEAKSYPRWSIEADATSNGVRFVRLRAPIDIPYRDIGGLIFRARQRNLSVSFGTNPFICPVEEE